MRKNKNDLRELISVPKPTTDDLGIIAVDRDGIIKLSNDRWFRLYGMKSAIPQDRKGVLLTHTGARLRQTFISKNGHNLLFLSVMPYTESLIQARNIFYDTESHLGACEIGLETYDISTVMQLIHDNYLFAGIGERRFIFASEIRRRTKSFKDICFVKPEEKEDHLEFKSAYVSSFFAMDFPQKLDANLLNIIARQGVTFILAIDFNPLGEDELISFNRILEKRYTKAVAQSEERYFNFSYTFSFICENESDMRHINEVFLREAAARGIVMSPAYGNQEKVFLSATSFGICDYNRCRNITRKKLGSYLI